MPVTNIHAPQYYIRTYVYGMVVVHNTELCIRADHLSCQAAGECPVQRLAHIYIVSSSVL